MSISALQNAITRGRHIERPGHYSSELEIVPARVHRRRVLAEIDRRWRETVQRELDEINAQRIAANALLIEAYKAKYPTPPKPAGRLLDATHIPTVGQVVEFVSAAYRVPVHALLSTQRSWRLVRPRHIAMYFAYQLTRRSYPEIGRMLGGRDHTTILHGHNKIARMIEEDEEFAAEIKSLRDELSARAR